MMIQIGMEPKTMTDVLGLYIKEVISAYPAVGDVLAKAGIGCVNCSVGTCLLKDVVGIHNLTESQEQALLAAIAGIIFPGRNMALPKTERTAPPAGSRTLSPPLQDLVNEHTHIKRVLALLPELAAALQPEMDAETGRLVAQVLDFIRQYADQFHHAKEEDILFRYFDAGSDILKIMCQEHEIGRKYVRSALTALEQGKSNDLAEHLYAYGVLLAEHIRKEDEILYPWMNGQLTDSQVGQLFSRFKSVDEKFGAGVNVQLGRVEEWEGALARRRSKAQ